MIPLRVHLHNFLCHADHEFHFEGHPVWLLHGPNGVGKSAVFDAMLYALFGVTRRSDSRKNAVIDVIRHGETSARVDFEFEHDSQRYRVWRIRPRTGQPKQGADKWVDGLWQPVANTAGKDDLEKWVAQTLGLTYEAFVSAILLRQGAAEKLIDADKEHRRDVLRSFIDLEPYLALHGRAADARRDLSAKVRTFQAQLRGMPEVTALDLVAARASVTEAAERHTAAKEAANLLRDLHGHARSWETLESERQQLQKQLDTSARRVAKAEEIRRQFDRLTELRTLVPTLRQVVTFRNELGTAEESIRRRKAENDKAASRQEALKSSFEQSKTRMNQLRDDVTYHELQTLKLEGELKVVGQEIERAQQATNLIQKLQELRSKTFPPNLSEQHAAAVQLSSEAQTARDARPYVEALVKHRADYHLATGEESAARVRLEMADADLNKLRQAEAAVGPEAKTAADRASQLKEGEAVARSQLKDARERQKHFAITAKQPVCSECGQAISAEHARKEKKKLEQAVLDAAERHQRAQDEARAAVEEAETAAQRQKELAKKLTDADHARSSFARDYEEAGRRAAKASTAFDQARGQLDHTFAARVDNIAVDGYPTAADAEAVRGIAGLLSQRDTDRDNLNAMLSDRDWTKDAIRTQEQYLQAYGAPPDVTAAKGRLAELDRTLKDLREQSDKNRQALSDEEAAVKQIEKESGDLTKHLTVLAAEVARAEENSTGLRQRLQEVAAALPQPFQARADAVTMAEVDRLDNEQREIETSGVEQEHKLLRDDLARLETRKQRLDEVLKLITQVPELARRPSSELERQVQAADLATDDSAGHHQGALNRLHTLTSQQEQREKLDCELADAEHQHTLHDRLVDLLGEKRLQLALVRGAEHQIVQQANDVLTRLSSGELRFEPPDLEGEKAFEIYVRRHGSEPIAVANLSGGQRFRVAVALALAVCQGAGDVARPLETVIIDEGFGALDIEGRSAMIAELRDGQSLGQLFKKVIVVSHQDDFASAFPVGYRLSAENGATRVEPFGLTPPASYPRQVWPAHLDNEGSVARRGNPNDGFP